MPCLRSFGGLEILVMRDIGGVGGIAGEGRTSFFEQSIGPV